MVCLIIGGLMKFYGMVPSELISSTTGLNQLSTKHATVKDIKGNYQPTIKLSVFLILWSTYQQVL